MQKTIARQFVFKLKLGKVVSKVALVGFLKFSGEFENLEPSYERFSLTPPSDKLSSSLYMYLGHKAR